MSLKGLIQDFIRLHNTTDEIVGHIVEKNEGWILRTIKLRIWNTGKDGNDKLIGRYAESTIKFKKAEGKRSSHVTLRDEGDFMDAFYVKYQGNGDVLVSSDDEKTPLIQQKYPSADIFGLTQQEQEMFVDAVLETEYNKILNSRKQVNLFESF